MSIRRFIIISVFAIVNILIYGLQHHKDSLVIQSSKQLISLNPNIITGMAIKPVKSDALIFKYFDKHWSLDKSDILLDQKQMRQLGGRLFALKALRSVPSEEIPNIGSRRGSFELSTTNKTIKVNVFGETLLDHNSYITLNNDDVVYVVEGNLADILLTDIDLLKRRQIFTIDAQDISEINIKSKHANILINQKNGIWKIRKPVEDWIDGKRLGTALSAIAGARAIKFIKGGVADLYTLFTAENADYIVTLKSKNLQTETAFIVFDKLSAKLYAMIPGSKTVVELDLLLINDVGALANEFRSPYIFVLPATNFVSLKINWQNKNINLVKQNKNIFINNKKVSFKNAVLFINKVLNLQIKSYLYPKNLNIPKHYNTIVLKTKEASLQVDFWKAKSQGYWARRHGEANIYRVDETQLPSFDIDLSHF